MIESDSVIALQTGHQTTDVGNTSLKQGRITIQRHSKGDVHYFRNIRIRLTP